MLGEVDPAAQQGREFTQYTAGTLKVTITRLVFKQLVS